MAEYVILFNAQWTPDISDAETAERGRAVRALAAQMRDAGALIVLGGVDPEDQVFSVDASSGTPVYTDGPYAETAEQLGGFAVIDVATQEEARHWAGRIATACGWPQEVHRLHTPRERQD